MKCRDQKEHDYWVRQGWACPLCCADQAKQDRVNDRDALADTVVTKLLEHPQFNRDVLRRLVRVETRNTGALRALGLLPNGAGEGCESGTAEVIYHDGRLTVTRLDLPMLEVARAAVLAGVTEETPIYHNGEQWGVYVPRH
jgi:hypothetical protein